jgi:hypothetical protein
MAAPARPFSELEEDFLRITTATVFSTATTVDPDGRPRNRVLHPIFVVRDGEPIGWGPAGMAGYGPERWNNPVFTPLRLDPWRVQVMRGKEYPRGNLTGTVWRRG